MTNLRTWPLPAIPARDTETRSVGPYLGPTRRRVSRLVWRQRVRPGSAS